MVNDPDKDKRFQKNLEMWSKTCPKQAFMLPYVNSRWLSPSVTAVGEPNLKAKLKTKTVNLHSNLGAVEEAKRWFKGLPLKDVALVCVYGVGLGYYYDAIAAWLKKDKGRHLVFLEDDAGVIQKLLETERGTKILQDPQVQLLYFEGVFPEEAVFDVLYWNFSMKRLIVTSLESYSKNKSVILADLRNKIAFDAAMKNALVDEYMRYGANYYINFYQNMLCLPDSYAGNKFFGKFQNVPAIICGAGPSLAKNLPLVKQLLDKAVVFAGGSALNVLNSGGFQPHFGAGIDPNPAQYTRMSLSKGYEVPFFYRNRMFHNAFKMIHGPRLYITGSGGYDTASYFEKSLGIEDQSIDEGHNVVNFCVEIAHAMGCNPIIFVGMDLAFTGMKEYAPGVVKNAAITQSAILGVEEDDSRGILKKDIFGKPTYTLWKWVAESEWIGDYAKNHAYLKMVNCTEGGLGFPGIANQTLKEVSKKLLTRSYDLGNRIHGETQNSVMEQVKYPKIVKTMTTLSASLQRVIDDLKILSKEAEDDIVALKKGKEKPMQSGRAALAETELLEEPAYKHVIEVFNEVYARMLSGDVHQIQVSRMSDAQRQIRRLELAVRKFNFLSDVATVNQELIAFAFKKLKTSSKAKKVVVKVPKSDAGSYFVKKRRMVLLDPELKLSVDVAFDPVVIPPKAKDSQKLKSGHVVHVFFDKQWKVCEAYLEKKGVLDGQALLYYPNGKIKSEMFYSNGRLHGPCKFWSLKGKLLAESWYVDGQQEGKCRWYYPSGKLYSVQRFKKGRWHGQQEYYYEDGAVKTLVSYDKDDVIGEPIMLLSDGKPSRQIEHS